MLSRLAFNTHRVSRWVRQTCVVTGLRHQSSSRLPTKAAVAPPAITSVPMATSPAMQASQTITYLSQSQAVSIDEELMGPLGFSVDQLMELAGLSVASALAEQYPVQRCSRVLVIAGPGNNGGDGLVAARHLTHFGYNVQVLYPKPTDKPLFHGLITQIKSLGIPLVDWTTIKGAGLASQYDVVVDAIFGFSFKGTPRPPFDDVLKALSPSASPPPILSVDIPSGWDVESGDTTGAGLRPDALVSLTAPKQGCANFQGAHYVGGRFVPPAVRDKYQLHLPAYPGTAQHVRISGPAPTTSTTAEATGAVGASEEQALKLKVADMRINYTRGGLDESHMAPYTSNPMKAWEEWFKIATDQKVCEEPNAIHLATVDPVTGQPTIRVVLLKGFDDRGFVFYTNYNSRKGQELSATGKAAFTVYWEALQRQVRVDGTVEKVSEEESAEYFQSRPRGSQVGAWVSQQSQVLPGGRGALDARKEELAAQYNDLSVPVPKPAHWGGFLIRPTAMEFWQGRPSRLHDRIRFRRSSPTAADWVMERLQP